MIVWRAVLGMVSVMLCATLPGCDGPSLPPGADHGSPAGAVRGLIATIERGNGNALTVIDWIAPSDSRAYRDLIGFNDRYDLTLTLRAQQVRITGTTYPSADRATVAFDGDVVSCADGVLPPPGRKAVHSCASIAASTRGGAALNCVREQGEWFVSFDIGSGGAMGGETTPPPRSG